MILRSRIRFISPHKWFPSHNPVAAVVARLCVLREDLYIELLGVAAEDISLTIPTMQSPLPNMDDNGDGYRRIYFMWASLRTLFEVRGAILVLVKNKEFAQRYEKWDKERFQELKDFLAELERNLSEFKRIRDAIGGHVLPQAITKAIDTMDYDEIGKYELGRTMKETHFGFAGTIRAQILLQDIPKKEKEEHFVADLHAQHANHPGDNGCFHHVYGGQRSSEPGVRTQRIFTWRLSRRDRPVFSGHLSGMPTYRELDNPIVFRTLST